MDPITLSAKLAFKALIVWTTVSTTTPAPIGGGSNTLAYAVYRPTMCNQVGEEYMVTTADIEWQGKVKTVELDRQPTGKQEQRSVDCSGVNPYLLDNRD